MSKNLKLMNFTVKNPKLMNFTAKNMKLMNFTADQKSHKNEFDSENSKILNATH